MDAQLYKYSKIHRIVPSKRVNFMLYELYLSKAIIYIYIYISIYIIHHIKDYKRKSLNCINRCRKSPGKTQHQFLVKRRKKNLLAEQEQKGTSSICFRASTDNIKLNDKRLKVFPLKSGIREGCLLSSLLFNTVLVQASIIRQERETKHNQIEKEVVKLSVQRGRGCQ